MKGRPHCWSFSILLFILAGCSSPSTGPKTPTPAADTAPGIKRVDASQLPSLGDYFPPLDGGRLMLASPAGWSWASRREGYLARIFLDKTRRVRLPRIWVTVEDPRNEATGQLTEENLVAHARFVHGVEDAALDGLEAVADVGQRARDDDAQGVLHEGRTHLLL